MFTWSYTYESFDVIFQTIKVFTLIYFLFVVPYWYAFEQGKLITSDQMLYKLYRD